MSKHNPILNKKSLLIGIAGLIVIVAILELTNTTHLLHKQSVPPVIPAHSNTGQPISSSSTSSPASSVSNSGPSQNNVSPAETANHTLIAPFGNFVSNHFPGQNGTSTSEASICNTSPGATCYIKFTNIATGENTQLTAQTTDAQGYTSWYWDTSKDAHLYSGQWQVTAVAALGSQVKSAEDPLKLTIQ